MDKVAGINVNKIHEIDGKKNRWRRREGEI